MITSYSSGNQSWIDLASPTKEELDSLILTQSIEPLAAKDLLSPTPKQGLVDFGTSLYLVVHIPSFRHSHRESTLQEIDFLLTANSLVTARYDSIDAIHHFAKQVEVNEALRKEGYPHLFFGLMREVYKFLSDEAEYMQDWIKEIEKNIFTGHEKEMVWSISMVGRHLLSFKRTVGPHKNLWIELSQVGHEKFGQEFTKEIKHLLNESERLIALIESVADILDELRETNNAMLSTKQNETMKILTIMAFVTFPLSLIASIFGMNTHIIPIVGLPYDFWIVIGIMFGLSLVMFTYFKYKRWI